MAWMGVTVALEGCDLTVTRWRFASLEKSPRQSLDSQGQCPAAMDLDGVKEPATNRRCRSRHLIDKDETASTWAAGDVLSSRARSIALYGVTQSSVKMACA
jgi:hypothetical protein